MTIRRAYLLLVVVATTVLGIIGAPYVAGVMFGLNVALAWALVIQERNKPCP